ncbi:MAG: hypothetical protein ACI8P9_002516 [Parasphingorhabdus sp.]|jgi:hypothetical protein
MEAKGDGDLPHACGKSLGNQSSTEYEGSRRDTGDLGTRFNKCIDTPCFAV